MPETVRGQPNPMLGLPTDAASERRLCDAAGAESGRPFTPPSARPRRAGATAPSATGWPNWARSNFVTPATASGALDALDVLVEQKSAFFARRGIANLFARPGYLDFYREFASQGQRRRTGACQRASRSATQVAAVNFALTLGGRYYYVLSSYTDGEMARLGPGAVHLHELMRYAIDKQFTMFDFTIGDERYKLDWCDGAQPLYDHVSVSTWRGALVAAPALHRQKAQAQDQADAAAVGRLQQGARLGRRARGASRVRPPPAAGAGGRSDMKILHVLRAPVGGLFRHVVDLAHGQIERGHEVGLIADSCARQRAFGEHARRAGAQACARPFALSASTGSRARPMLAAVWHVARRIQATGAEIVHGHGAKGGALARLAPARQAVLRAYTPHGGSLHDAVGGRICILMERALKRRGQLYLFESAYSHDVYRRKVGRPAGSRPRRAQRHPHGRMRAGRARRRSADFVYLGEMRALKGVDVLIDALARLQYGGRRLTATLIGDGPDAALVSRQGRRAGLAGPGALPQADAGAPGVGARPYRGGAVARRIAALCRAGGGGGRQAAGRDQGRRHSRSVRAAGRVAWWRRTMSAPWPRRIVDAVDRPAATRGRSHGAARAHPDGVFGRRHGGRRAQRLPSGARDGRIGRATRPVHAAPAISRPLEYALTVGPISAARTGCLTGVLLAVTAGLAGRCQHARRAVVTMPTGGGAPARSSRGGARPTWRRRSSAPWHAARSARSPFRSCVATTSGSNFRPLAGRHHMHHVVAFLLQLLEQRRQRQRRVRDGCRASG